MFVGGEPALLLTCEKLFFLFRENQRMIGEVLAVYFSSVHQLAMARF